MMLPDFNMEDDNAAMSNEIYQHLKKLGLAFPDNKEEFHQFIATISNTMQVSTELPSPDDILKNGILSLAGSLNESTDFQIQENLAQAAREGGEIPDEILKQMEADRQKSEEEQQNDD
ncbi:MAG: hypothetical protein QM802_20595 [Agriterribacter sp.]